MTINQLAQEIVQFVAQGVTEVIAAYDAIAARAAAFAAGTLRAIPGGQQLGAALSRAFANPQAALFNLGRGITRVAMQMRGLSMLARRFVLGGGLTIAGILFGAGRNTTEVDQFKEALDKLVRVMGDRLAPYVRAVTSGLQQMTQWWKSLSLETRNTITQWALVTVALAGLAATLPFIIRGIGSLLMVLSMLADPLILIPALVLAAAAAILYLTSTGDTFADRMADMAQTVIQAWFAIRGVVKAITSEIADLIHGVSEIIGHQIKSLKALLSGNIQEAAHEAIEAQIASVMALIRAAGADQRKDKIFDEEGKAAQKWAEMAKRKVKDVADFMKGINNGAGFTPKAKVEFESLQGTWDRLQKHFIENDQDNVEKQKLDAIKGAQAALEKANGQLDVIADKLPMVV